MGKGKKPSTAAVARELVLPVLEELGLSLWDVRFEKEGANWYLRYFIDKPGGVNIQDCADVSRAVGKRLDEVDPIEQSYTLEVCSPGTERQLVRDEHFRQYIGQRVNVRLFQAVEGVRDFLGVLTAKEGDEITLLLESAGEGDPPLEMKFGKNEAAYVKLYAEYDTGGLE